MWSLPTRKEGVTSFHSAFGSYNQLLFQVKEEVREKEREEEEEEDGIQRRCFIYLKTNNTITITHNHTMSFQLIILVNICDVGTYGEKK